MKLRIEGDATRTGILIKSESGAVVDGLARIRLDVNADPLKKPKVSLEVDPASVIFGLDCEARFMVGARFRDAVEAVVGPVDWIRVFDVLEGRRAPEPSDPLGDEQSD